MTKSKILYLFTTLLISATMLYSSFTYFTTQEAKDSFLRLGFPDYFRIQLGVAKALGAVVLILPHLRRLKEVAYTGFAITFLSAFIAHMANSDPMHVAIQALVLLMILATSWFCFHRLTPAI